MNNENYYYTLVLRYLEGSLSPSELLDLEFWLDQDDANRHFYYKIKLNWNGNLPKEPVFNSKLAYKAVLNTITNSPVESAPVEIKPQKHHVLAQWLRLAAVFAGIIIMSYFAYVEFFTGITYVTDVDETATVILPDNSIVTLYPSSSLTYDRNWSDKKLRKVSLEGEAFFDVTRKKKPFIVRTSDIAIRVLGTSFNVKSYSQDELIETTLVEGKVRINDINNRRKRLVLQPNQKATFSRTTQDLTLTEVSTNHLSSLKNGTFVFHNERVSEIIKVISKKFGVKIKTHKEIKNCTVTADFSDQPLERTMDLLCKLINARYALEGDMVSLIGKGCRG